MILDYYAARKAVLESEAVWMLRCPSCGIEHARTAVEGSDLGSIIGHYCDAPSCRLRAVVRFDRVNLGLRSPGDPDAVGIDWPDDRAWVYADLTNENGYIRGVFLNWLMG